MVNLMIDDKTVQVPEGTNLIDAAEACGVHIPNLCYLKGMKGIGACRLCLVEIEGMKAPMIGCTTKVKEGMVVRTVTEKIQEIRKFVIDLILSMHPLDCMTCTKAGVCNLQKYAYDFELKESTFTRKQFGYSIDEANPFIKRDPDYCILCGRCVRVCKAQGTEVLDFYGRGEVVTANDDPLQQTACTFCGSCVDVCPVNALLEADRWRKGREWECEKTASVCLSCGNGCDITVNTKDGEAVKVTTGTPDGRAERFICAIGRFGFDSLSSEMRVTSPMKKVNGELKETTWEDALRTAAAKLKAAGKEASFLLSGNILNEDAVLMKKLAADAVKTKNIATSVSLYSDDDAMKSSGADIETADLIVLAGIAPDQWKRVLPALDAVIRKRMTAGAKLIVINSGEPRIAGSAVAVMKGDEAGQIEELSQALIAKGIKAPREMVEALVQVDPSDHAMEVADIFIESRSPVIIASPALYKAAANLSLIKGDALAMPFEANAKGIVMMGISAEDKKFRDIAGSPGKVLFAVGEVPLAKRPETGFLIVQNSHMTDLATQADLVLPSTPGMESEGTMIDYLGRLKAVNRVCEPRGEAKPHADIFISIAKGLGKDLKMVKETEIKKAAKAKAKPVFGSFEKSKGLTMDAEAFLKEINRSTVNGSRLIWLEEIETATATQ
jgi:NADH dehydrogenase/NADH:ubiquinone oxidoreductase subunit G